LKFSSSSANWRSLRSSCRLQWRRTAIRDDLRGRIEQASIGKRAHGEDDACGVAAGIGDELSRSEFVRVKLRQAVDGGIEPCSVRARGACTRIERPAASRKRNAPLRSMTLTPASRSFGASSADTSCGVRETRVLAPVAKMFSTDNGRRGARPMPRSWGEKFREAVSALRVPHEKRCG